MSCQPMKINERPNLCSFAVLVIISTHILDLLCPSYCACCELFENYDRNVQVDLLFFYRLDIYYLEKISQ